MNDLQKFTEFLYGGLTGYVYTPVKKKDQSWHQNFFLWPEQKEDLHAFIETSKNDGDVYISPVVFSEKSSKKTAVKATNVAWVEFDGKEKSFGALPEPNLVVQSSTEDHLHCYWKIPVATAEAVEEINRRLTYYLEADSSGWDANQVLRPPTTLNWKSLRPKPVKLLSSTEGINAFESFDSAPVVRAPIEQTKYDDLLDPATIKLTDELNALVNINKPVQGHRSSYLMALGHLLAESDFTQLQIVTLLYVADCRIKKFVGRDDQLVRLSEIAAIALLKIEAETSVESYSPLEIIRYERSLNWYMDGWLHSQGMMLLSGAPGVGKTQFSFDLAYRLATASPINYKVSTDPLNVTVISLEMDIVELKYIFEKQAQGFENHELWNSNVRVFSYDDGSLQAYEKAIKESKPHVVIIDSLSEMAQEDLKESEARALMRWFKKMRRTYNCAFIVIHHNRKANDSNKKPRKLSDLYGSYIFAKLSETVISLWQEEGKSYLDVDSLKVRFGSAAPKRIKRTDHLTFEWVSNDVTATDELGTHVIETGSILGFK